VLSGVAKAKLPRHLVSVSGSITVIAGAIAIVAGARAFQLGRRLDDERAARLSRALVVHGAAVLVVGASAVLGGGLGWITAVLVALATGSWGVAWILIGRSYEADPEARERRLEALRREERAARATPPVPRFDRSEELRGRPRDGARHGQPTRRGR
jgi:hypothetical protein